MTISRALRDSPLVRPSTRKRLQQIAQKHGYRLNVTARNLRLQHSRTIAVVVDMRPSDDRPLSDAFPLVLLGGICQELTTQGYSVLLTTKDGIAAPAVRGSDGIILLGQGARDDAVHQIQPFNVPFIVWGAHRPGERYVVVGSDNRDGGRKAAQQLLARGRRALAFLGDIDHPELKDRYRGMQEVATAATGQVPHSEQCEFTSLSGSQAVERLLRDKRVFDGLFACSDLVAAGAMQALAVAGLRVPEDVAVVGYDDSSIALACSPPLTTVHQNWPEGGRLLARKLLELIRGAAPRSEMLPTTLVVRGS